MVVGAAIPASGRADPRASWPDPVASGQIWWLPSSPAHSSFGGWDTVVAGQGCLGAILLSPLLLRLRLGQRWWGGRGGAVVGLVVCCDVALAVAAARAEAAVVWLR
jgi:hypothetical protein